MRTLLFVVLLAIAPLATAGSIAYKNFYGPLAKAAAADPDHRLRLRLKIKPKDDAVALSTVALELVSGAEKTPLPLDARGLFDLPLRKDWADADAQIVSNQPKGTLTINMFVTVNAPPGTTQSYADLMKAVPAMNQAIKAYAGMMSLFAPSCRGVAFVFGGTEPQRATYRRADGTEVVLASKPSEDGTKQRIELERDDKLVAENPKLTLSAEPEVVDPLM